MTQPAIHQVINTGKDRILIKGLKVVSGRETVTKDVWLGTQMDAKTPNGIPHRVQVTATELEALKKLKAFQGYVTSGAIEVR